MTQGTQSISLKQDGQWLGLSDESTMLPTSGAFKVLEGCYITRSGDEIRGCPGSKVVARMFFGDKFDIGSTSSFVSGTSITLTLDVSERGNGDHFLESGQPIATTALNSSGDLLYYDNVSVVSVTQITVTDSRVDTDPGSSGEVFLGRRKFIHALASVDGRPIALAETEVNDLAVSKTNVAATVGPRLSMLSVAEIGTTSSGVEFYPSPTMLPPNAKNDQTPAAWDMDLLGRMTADKLNSKLAVAVPGHGCLFQVDLDAAPPRYPYVPPTYDARPDYRWMRMLGVPKGVMLKNPVVDESPTLDLLPNGTYYFAVGYINTRTGVVGVPSEPVEYIHPSAATPTGKDPILRLIPPRQVAPETMGLGIILYISATNGSPSALWPAILIGPWDTNTEPGLLNNGATAGAFDVVNNHEAARIVVSFAGDSARPLQPNRVPAVESYMLGGGWVRTVTERLFSGGDPRGVYKFEGWFWTSGSGFESNTISVRTEFNSAGDNISPLAWWRVGQGFGGNRLVFDFNSTIASPYYPENATFVGTGNAVEDPSTNTRHVTLTTDHTLPATTTPTFEDMWIESDPNRIQYTEAGFTESAPKTNALIADLKEGKITTGSAQIGDALLVMTDRATSLYSWGVTPNQNSSVLLSSLYGCVSANSVVTGPFGAAWLSHDGPVISNGASVEWIGRRIHEFWKTVIREDDFMANHAHGVVDLKRELIIWHVSTTNAGTNAARIRAEGDAQIIFSYATGAFSTQRRSDTLAARGATLLPIQKALGLEELEPCFICNSGAGTVSLTEPLYAWDDDCIDQAWDDLSVTSVQSALVTADRAVGGTSITYSPQGGWSSTNLEKGVVILVVSMRNELRCVLKASNTATGDTLPVVSYTKSDGTEPLQVDWRAGDTLYFRAQPIHMETPRLKAAMAGQDTKYCGMSVRAELGSVAQAWAITSTVETDGTRTTHGAPRRLRTGDNNYAFGRVIADDVGVALDVYRTGPIRIKDISVEVEP